MVLSSEEESYLIEEDSSYDDKENVAPQNKIPKKDSLKQNTVVKLVLRDKKSVRRDSKRSSSGGAESCNEESHVSSSELAGGRRKRKSERDLTYLKKELKKEFLWSREKII